MQDLLVNIVGGIIVLLIGGYLGYLRGRSLEREMYEQRHSEAVKTYFRNIGLAIDTAFVHGPNDIRVNGRAIVTIRDDLRGTLISLSKLLNSDIDTLDSQIKSLSSLKTTDTVLAARAFETIRVLKRKWPAKSDQIEIETRKLLTELGLVESPRRPS